MMKKILAVSFIPVFVLFGAMVFPVACAHSGSDMSPCELLSQSDVETLFQEKVHQGAMRTTTAPAGRSCRYSFEKDGNVFGVSVKVSRTVEISQEGIFDSAGDVFDRQVKARKAGSHSSGHFRQIQETGDDAFWDGSALWVLRGESLVVITVNSILKGSFDSRNALDSAQEEQDLQFSLKAAARILDRLDK